MKRGARTKHGIGRPGSGSLEPERDKARSMTIPLMHTLTSTTPVESVNTSFPTSFTYRKLPNINPGKILVTDLPRMTIIPAPLYSAVTQKKSNAVI